ncbi:unnamed protein product [Rotaria sp. Silwood1]|nr:unnamed protein product [Rotaria sp. Silwood1]CAF1618458.1 unnamed protein product [Rotaria sp. Silwood1]CAF3734502.1 unnamed protein product [Rotaria sp. Silwood1]CAF3758923.1 unnamed protein product [Rotaria sp. Silwood1]CAF3810858.1 unnamed protein product [Rotaria sp. Silwood1]
MHAEWNEIKNNDELIQQRIEKYSTKHKLNLAQNSLLLWAKNSNSNSSTKSNIIILDDSPSSTSSATTTINSTVTNDVGANLTMNKSQKNAKPKNVVQNHLRGVAQEKVFNELTEVNERIATLVQLKHKLVYQQLKMKNN